MRSTLAPAILALFALGAGAMDRPAQPPATPRKTAEAAWPAARRAILEFEKLDAGTIWNLRQGLRRFPDDELAEFLDRAAERLAGTAYERLVRPDAPRFPLPESPGSGMQRMANYSRAPVGAPVERAIAWIDDATSSPGTGYTLTHQFLYLEWARQTGLELPTEVSDRRHGLLERIAAEQARDRRFSDLYAERVFVLTLFGDPAEADVERWIETIVAAQIDNGRWDSRGSRTATGSPHTTGLCAAVLMDRLAPED